MDSRVVLSGAFALLFIGSAWAHHPGGASSSDSAGPIYTISASTLEEGRGAIAFLYEYIRFGGLSDADLINAASKHIHAHTIGSIQSPWFGFAYGVTDDLTISFRAPYVRRTDIREGHHSHVGGVAMNVVDARGDAAGFGDVTALGQFRFINNQATATEVAALFGLKAPTGATDARDRFGEAFETEFLPGSGSWDGLFGLAASQRFGALSVHGNALLVLAGAGAQDTNLGNRVLYNAALAYRLIGAAQSGSGVAPRLTSAVLSHSPIEREHQHAHVPEPPTPAAPAKLALDAIIELNGEWHDFTRIAGVKDLNSGGNVIYLSPGLRLSYVNSSSFISLGIPIINDPNGLQSKPSYRLLAGIALGF